MRVNSGAVKAHTICLKFEADSIANIPQRHKKSSRMGLGKKGVSSTQVQLIVADTRDATRAVSHPHSLTSSRKHHHINHISKRIIL